MQPCAGLLHGSAGYAHPPASTHSAFGFRPAHRRPRSFHPIFPLPRSSTRLRAPQPVAATCRTSTVNLRGSVAALAYISSAATADPLLIHPTLPPPPPRSWPQRGSHACPAHATWPVEQLGSWAVACAPTTGRSDISCSGACACHAGMRADTPHACRRGHGPVLAHRLARQWSMRQCSRQRAADDGRRPWRMQRRPRASTHALLRLRR